VQKKAKEYKMTPGRSQAFKNEMWPDNFAVLKDDFLS
jgi:hypothetical protein